MKGCIIHGRRWSVVPSRQGIAIVELAGSGARYFDNEAELRNWLRKERRG